MTIRVKRGTLAKLAQAQVSKRKAFLRSLGARSCEGAVVVKGRARSFVSG